MARSLQYDDTKKQAAQDAVDFDGMAAELRLTEECAARLGAPVVWSHNDLLSGNVLVALKVRLACVTFFRHQDEACQSARWHALQQEPGLRGEAGTVPSMQFIDFEYGAHAPRGFDWGNHFNEYAGFECEYSRYPDNTHVSNFVRAYLAEGAQNLPVRPWQGRIAACNSFETGNRLEHVPRRPMRRLRLEWRRRTSLRWCRTSTGACGPSSRHATRRSTSTILVTASCAGASTTAASRSSWMPCSRS